MARLGPMTSSRSGIQITTDTFDGIEEYIRWCEHVPRQMPRAMNLLTRYMALANMGISQKMSAGPYDPQQRRPELAWRIPVRRISERYYIGWKIKRIRMGVWMVYNDSREAFFIEFGINPRSSRRVRRPIRKLALKKTLVAMMRTHAYHRVWAEIYVDPNRRGRGRGFTQHVQSPVSIRGNMSSTVPSGMGAFTGPQTGSYLP